MESGYSDDGRLQDTERILYYVVGIMISEWNFLYIYIYIYMCMCVCVCVCVCVASQSQDLQ
jgi:hypothetical protein